ncbi:MAG: EAL domain-containing protein [Clostridium sp.]|jgi:diguanylate cyclase (GGDEF)-like protein|nr:EAL domain-containing protein [Clostridium sp.]
MDELRYQLDLLKAVNRKLSAKERMYHLICDTSRNAYLYYSFGKKELALIGQWEAVFPFRMDEWKKVTKILDIVDEQAALPLRDVLFLEKSGLESAHIEVLLPNEKKWLEFRTDVIYDDDGGATDKIVRVRNITKEKTQAEELKYATHYDVSTGLYNRSYYVHKLGKYLSRAKKEHAVVSVLLIDIDDLGKVNDGLRIVIGDELIRQFGAVLKEFSQENVIACHLNSDVYGMAVYDPVGSRSIEQIHRGIRERIREPFLLSSGQKLHVTVSIGVAEFPEAGLTPSELISMAEIVLYKGKKKSKGAIQYYDASVLLEFRQNIEFEDKLKEAVRDKSFLLHYQPQYHTQSRRLRGVEALIRMADTGDGIVSPGIFIPVAEKTGSIVQIGQWVMEESIRQYAEWKQKYGCRMVMSINVSPVQYNSEDFVDALLRILKKYEVKPFEIEIEITESILIDDFLTVSEKLRKLRDYGVRISLDDFGTGFSSLSYLKRLPIDTLKIDKSFIDTVLTDSATRVITEAIISMVKALGFESVAEGVEEENQYDYLQVIGCDVIQGYYLGKPQPARDIGELLEKEEKAY